MPKHEYTARDALALLIQRVDAVSPELAGRMTIAIDSGKEVRVIDDQAAARRGRRTEVRYYRKNSPYEDEEAVSVAIKVLRAHLVEIRLFANSASTEFALAAVAGPKPTEPEEAKAEVIDPATVGPAKAIAIQLDPETVQKPRNPGNAELPIADAQQLQNLRDLLARLAELLDFTGA